MKIKTSSDVQQEAAKLVRLEERYLLGTITLDQVLSALVKIELVASQAVNNSMLCEHVRHQSEALLNDALVIHQLLDEDESSSKVVYSIIMALFALGGVLYVIATNS